MLTAQKRKFALALMSGSPKSEAARLAGYSERTARSQGSRLAKDPEVIAFIGRKKKEKNEVDDVPGFGKRVKAPPPPPSVEIPPMDRPPELACSLTYDDPLEYLKAVMNGLEEDDMGRRDAAKAMLPYIHTKKGEGGKKDAKNEAAKKAANKFAVQQPPKLVVNNRGK